MGLSDYLGLLSGLSLFLFGMQMMSQGLEEGLKDHLKSFLLKLTDHRIKAIVMGTLVTGIIQSSSAVSVLLIGLVNAKVISLQRAIWVIMGANIGTTMTGQMIALDIGVLAPFLAIIGVFFFIVAKGFWQICGQVIGAMGILFIGLEMMAHSMLPLQHSATFVRFLLQVSSPILGILAGMIFTAIIQSSSASIGIVQMLASQNLISFSQSVYLILGFDMGTCMTGFIASLSGNLLAKRLALFHFLFNFVGMICFVILCQCLPLISWIESLTPTSSLHQIANMHTLFNVVTTLIVLQCERQMIRIIEWVLPQRRKLCAR